MVGAYSRYSSTFELAHVLAPIAKEEVAFALLLEVVDLPIVDLPLRVLDFTIPYHFVFVPFS
jgi:hypothetical protein